MEASRDVADAVLLQRYEALRDTARDFITADPSTMLNVYDTYVCLCETHAYPANAHFLEYLARYARVQGAIANGTAQGMLCTVRRLDFSSTYVGKAVAWLPIFVTLSDCVLLHQLSVSGQQLSSDLAVLLARSLTPLVQLAHLDVSGNPIGCAGVQALIRLVKASPTLVECDIHGATSIALLSRQLEAALARNHSPATLPPPKEVVRC